MSRLTLLAALPLLALACQTTPDEASTYSADSTRAKGSPAKPGKAASRPARGARPNGVTLAQAPKEGLAVATFAGGCFWCVEQAFDEVAAGVTSADSGYTGGPEKRPTYNQVASKKTGHVEAVRVTFDPKIITYEQLLDVFWRSFDPTDNKGQFADRGSAYYPAIFVHSDEQRVAALASKAALQKSGRFKKKVITPIRPAAEFWIAEGRHQDYARLHPTRYMRYKKGSGRARFLKKHWKK